MADDERVEKSDTPSPGAVKAAREYLGGEIPEVWYLAHALDEFARQAVEQEREQCATISDEYASVNEAAGDTVLHDPVLSGRDRSPEAFEKSREMSINGCVHSAMFHAARNIAAAIRGRSDAQR